MSAFNILNYKTICPNCNKRINLKLQFKYGDTWQYIYDMGQVIGWGGNDIGKPDYKNVVVDAASEDCPNCGFDFQMNFEIFIKDNKIISANPATDRHNFSIINETYIVLDD